MVTLSVAEPSLLVLASQRPLCRSATPPASGACPCSPCPLHPPPLLGPVLGPGGPAPAWRGPLASLSWTSEKVPASTRTPPPLTWVTHCCQARLTVSPPVPATQTPTDQRGAGDLGWGLDTREDGGVLAVGWGPGPLQNWNEAVRGPTRFQGSPTPGLQAEAGEPGPVRCAALAGTC